MKNIIDPNIKPDANGETSFGNFSEPVRSPNAWRYILNSFRRTGLWLVECLTAHNDRVAALRAYGQYRVDVHKTNNSDV